MQKQIFISYSRQDRGLLHKICDELRRAELDFWTDEELEPGTESWTKAIEIAIENALALVVILTPNSKKSKFVTEEMNYAKHQDIKIIPILAAGDEKTSIPFGYSTWQWIDIRFNPDSELIAFIGALQKLANALITSDSSPDKLASEVFDSLPSTQDFSAPHSMEAYRIAERDNSPIVVLSDLVERVKNPRLLQENLSAGPYPYYGATGIINYIDEYNLEGEFLLISRVGSSLVTRSSPIAFKASGQFATNGNAHILRPKGELVILDYLMHYFSLADLRLYAKGFDRPTLNWSDLAEFPIVLPPLDEQQRRINLIAKQLEDVKQAREAIATQMAAVNEIEVALLRRTIQGEI